MAIDFSGTGQYLTAATAPVTAVPLTLFARINLDTVSGNQGILGVYDTGAEQSFYIATAGNKLTAITKGADYRIAQTTATISTATWYAVCGVFASTSSRKIYLDGSNVVENTATDTPTGLDTVGIAAYRSAPASGWIALLNGRIAECAIWNVALDAAEVAALNVYSPALIRPASLVWYAGLVRDYTTRKGVAATATGSPTVSPHPRIIMPRRRSIITAPAAAISGRIFKLVGEGGLAGGNRGLAA